MNQKYYKLSIVDPESYENLYELFCNMDENKVKECKNQTQIIKNIFLIHQEIQEELEKAELAIGNIQEISYSEYSNQ